MKLSYRFALLAVLCVTTPLSGLSAPADTGANWKDILQQRLLLYGHRNWIVIADSAYPAQTSSGVETIVSGANQLDVVQQVLDSISSSKHVRPIVHVDKELQFVDDRDAPGVSVYRQQLSALLRGRTQQPMLHDQIIAKLGQVSRNFRVLIIKTNMTIPYTTVFLELRASYWSDDNERKLRTAMGTQRR
jgi:L-fucose mutarotase/ribose pyranase (RbsD/FucU family)